MHTGGTGWPRRGRMPRMPPQDAAPIHTRADVRLPNPTGVQVSGYRTIEERSRIQWVVRDRHGRIRKYLSCAHEAREWNASIRIGECSGSYATSISIPIPEPKDPQVSKATTSRTKLERDTRAAAMEGR